MKILVANLGSTSFKYRLFDMTDERVLARGGVERIGAAESRSFVEANGRKEETAVVAPDHAAAVRLCLAQLSHPKRRALKDPSELAAIGFKAVHARGVTGVQRVDEKVLAAMDEPRPTTRRTRERCGCWPASCRRSRWWRRSRPGFTKRFRRRSGCTRSRWNGPRRTASSAGGFTGPAIATSPAGRRNCWVSPGRRSSPAISAGAVRCVRSRPASRGPTASA